MSKHIVESYDVKDFIEIRNTGRFGDIPVGNMFSPVVRQVLALSKKGHQYIIQNFDQLCADFNICPDTGEQQ